MRTHVCNCVSMHGYICFPALNPKMTPDNNRAAHNCSKIPFTKYKNGLMAGRDPLVNDMQTFKIPPSAAPSILIHMEFPTQIVQIIFSLKCIVHTKNALVFFFFLFFLKYEQWKELCMCKNQTFKWANVLQYRWLTFRWNCCTRFNELMFTCCDVISVWSSCFLGMNPSMFFTWPGPMLMSALMSDRRQCFV